MYQQQELAVVADDTTIRILDTALEQLETFGLRRLTIEDIARRAEVSRVTVYRRFGTKDALVQAVVLREVQRFFAALERAIAPYDDIGDRLAEGFAFTLEFLRNHSLLNRLLTTESEAVLPYATVAGGPLLETARHNLAALLTTAVAEGRLPPTDVDLPAELLARLVLSFLLTPQSVADLATADNARTFAREVLLPIVEGQARR